MYRRSSWQTRCSPVLRNTRGRVAPEKAQPLGGAGGKGRLMKMRDSDRMQELIDFFEEYAEFLTQMSGDENEKLEALLSGELPRIEHAISMAQANAKKLENLEVRRQTLQRRAGCDGMTFSQIISQSTPEDEPMLQSLFERIQSCVEEIKFRNGKSMGVARANMHQADPQTLLAKSDGMPTNAYIKAKAEAGRVTMLETKV